MLEECGTKFIVLAPGPSDQLEAIRDRIGFDAPFVEDKGLRIAESLGLKLSEDEIQPAIFVVEPDLTVGWTQRGRNGGYYGDDALLEEIACARRQRI